MVGSQILCPSCQHEIIISTISSATDFAAIRKREKAFFVDDSDYYHQKKRTTPYPNANRSRKQQANDSVFDDNKKLGKQNKKKSADDKKSRQQSRVKKQKRSLKFQCSFCGQQLKTFADLYGTRVLCPTCNNYTIANCNNYTIANTTQTSIGNNNMPPPKKPFFTFDNNNLGTGDILIATSPLWIIFLLAFFSLFFSCDGSKSSTNTTTKSPPRSPIQTVEQNSSKWLDDSDPIKWRKEEEQLERGSGLSNAKYACRRCGMKSHYSLDDGVNGLGGVCMYCLNYMVERKKQGCLSSKYALTAENLIF